MREIPALTDPFFYDAIDNLIPRSFWILDCLEHSHVNVHPNAHRMASATKSNGISLSISIRRQIGGETWSKETFRRCTVEAFSIGGGCSVVTLAFVFDPFATIPFQENLQVSAHEKLTKFHEKEPAFFPMPNLIQCDFRF
jgi:hypothetical protein